MSASLYEEDIIAPAEVGQNLIKASLFNLIVISNNPDRKHRDQELVRIITEKYPCRVIFISLDPTNNSDFVRTTNSLQIVGTGSGRVLCEVITIEAAHTQTHKIPFMILPHILPDLPVYLLLGHDPSHDPILQHIQKYAARTLFDVDSFDNFPAFAERILASMQKATCSCDLIDINWARTRAWRDSIARAFNSAESLKQLSQAKSIQISYVAQPDTQESKTRSEIQAIYLQAWLASKLNWTLLSVEREAKNIRINYKYDHVSVSISCVPKDTPILPAGSVFSFEVMTHEDYHFLISHENDPKIVKVHASNPERCEMPYSIFLPNFQNGPALVSELFHQIPSDHYRATLKELTHSMWNSI